MPKGHDEDVDASSDDVFDVRDKNDAPSFERVRKQQGKATTLKGDRRQQSKEFGRAMFKYHKERRKSGDDKP